MYFCLKKIITNKVVYQGRLSIIDYLSKPFIKQRRRNDQYLQYLSRQQRCPSATIIFAGHRSLRCATIPLAERLRKLLT